MLTPAEKLAKGEEKGQSAPGGLSYSLPCGFDTSQSLSLSSQVFVKPCERQHIILMTLSLSVTVCQSLAVIVRQSSPR